MKLWLVIVMDKELAGEPDIGCSLIEGNERAAKRAADELETACIKAGRRRCIARYREIERGKQYRLLALVRTA